MTLVSDLVAETKTYFLGGIREQKNKLASGGLTAVTTDDDLTFTYDLGPIKPGAVITVGLERMLVWSSSDATNTAVVQRAYDGTTLAAHTAGDLVSVNARIDDFAIVRGFNNVLNALTARGIYRRRAGEGTYNPAVYGYDLVSPTFGTIIGPPLAVEVEGTGTGEWTPLPSSAWSYNVSADTDDFPSGRRISVAIGSTGLAVRVVYRSPFTAITALSQDVQTAIFLPSTANDLLPMGAALQLGAARPMARADLQAQGSTKRNDETSVQDTLIAVAGLRSQYDQRILYEATRLASEDPQTL